MQNNGDEIEYFGFLPITFTTDLQESLEEALKEIFQTNTVFSQKVESHLMDSFKKNIFIFNNFVLRNILKFPTSFRLERRITDKLIKADTNKLLQRLQEKQKRLLELNKELRSKQESLRMVMDRKNGYSSLLKNKTMYEDMIFGAKEIKGFLKESTSLYENYQIANNRREGDFDKLMEYKNIKSDYYRTERDRIFEVAGLDSLEYINKHMN